MESQDLDIVKSDFLGEMLLKGAQALRNNEQLLDFTIIAEGTRFPVHKFILIASSDFFKAMLQHPQSIECQTNECHLKDIAPVVLAPILDFCYTSQIGLNIENVQEILIAASILQIDALQPLCVDYIVERIDVTNCVSFLNLGDRCNLPTLTEKALEWCLDGFDTISKTQEFLQLDIGLVSKIISHDELRVANEKLVFCAVEKWVAANNKAGIGALDTLAAHVRFPLMSPLSLINLSRDDHVRQSEKRRDLIAEAKDYHLLKEFPGHKLGTKLVGKRFETRRPLDRQRRIFAVGDGDTAEKYDPYLGKWIEVRNMTRAGQRFFDMRREGRRYVGAAILDDCLYAVGGWRDDMYLRSVDCYDIKKDIWRRDVTEMMYERSHVGVCTWRGYIYAIGGRAGPFDLLDVVERYDPQDNEWETCPSLNAGRYGAGVTVCRDKIFALGGALNNEDDGTVAIASVERFDEFIDKWSFVAPMSTCRLNCACTTFEDKIYVVGGMSGGGEEDFELLNTGECYDPIENRWEPIPPMSVKRSGLGLVEMDGLLYAVGGTDGNERPKLVEAYDPVKKEWTTKCPTLQARLGMGLALYSPMKPQSPREIHFVL